MLDYEGRCVCGYQRSDSDEEPKDFQNYIHYTAEGATITLRKDGTETQIWFYENTVYEKTDDGESIHEFFEGYINIYERFTDNGEWTKTTDESGLFYSAGEYVYSKFSVLSDIELVTRDNINKFIYDKNTKTLKLENVEVGAYKNLKNLICFNEEFEILKVEFEFIFNDENYSLTFDFDDFEVEIPKVSSANLSVELLPDGTYVLSNIGNCDDKDLVIPSRIGDIEITAIAPNAFANSDIRSVVIPGSVKTIGSGAFEECRSLSYVYIDEGVEKICENAFSMIDPRAEIHMHDTVTVIEDDAFNIDVAVASRGKWYFYGDINNYVQIEFGNERSNPNLNLDMYLNGEILTDVIIDTATYIAAEAFASLDSPKNYYIGKQVKSIGYMATGGFEVDIDPETGAMLFIPYNVYYEGSFEDFLKIDIEGQWVSASGCNLYCEGNLIETVEFPEGTTVIPEGIFSSCISIKNIIIPEGVTKIEKYAFAGCPVLNLTLPTSLLEIEYDAFDMYGLYISPDNNAITELDGAYYMAANGNPYYVLLPADDGIEIHPDCVIVMNSAE